MIVIPRKAGESIVISDNIVVTVIEVRGDRVRLGIEYSPEVSVHRGEIYEAIRKDEAASAPPQ